eukprot:1156706-Pelagomonas_calceolata.AAC.12
MAAGCTFEEGARTQAARAKVEGRHAILAPAVCMRKYVQLSGLARSPRVPAAVHSSGKQKPADCGCPGHPELGCGVVGLFNNFEVDPPLPEEEPVFPICAKAASLAQCFRAAFALVSSLKKLLFHPTIIACNASYTRSRCGGSEGLALH